jgi:hypothetical protein
LVKGEQFKVMDVSIYHACSTRHIIICQAKAMPADELMELLTRHHRAVLIQIDGHFSCPTGLIIDFGNINSGLLHRFLIRPPCLMHKIERAT